MYQYATSTPIRSSRMSWSNRARQSSYWVSQRSSQPWAAAMRGEARMTRDETASACKSRVIVVSRRGNSCAHGGDGVDIVCDGALCRRGRRRPTAVSQICVCGCSAVAQRQPQCTTKFSLVPDCPSPTDLARPLLYGARMTAPTPDRSNCPSATMAADASAGTPHVSIVMPTYNRGPLLAGAVRSVLDQSPAITPAFELIVVDNN